MRHYLAGDFCEPDRSFFADGREGTYHYSEADGLGVVETPEGASFTTDDIGDDFVPDAEVLS